MNDLQKYIHLSKYARYLDSEKRRETWEETVDRYFGFFLMQDKFQGWVDSDVPSGNGWEPLIKAVKSMDIMPSMRALMTAGPALERDNVSGFNPVVGTTKVLTKEFGYLPISALEDKEATVLNVNSKWTKAKFKCYGKQSIRKVVLKKNSNTMHTMYCTGNHRWVDVDGNVLSTDQLKPGKGGTKIPFASYKRNVDTDSIDYKLGCVHGIIFGDGTTQYSQKRVKGYMIRVCEDQEEFSKYFEFLPEVRISYPPSANGDPVIKLFSDFAKTHDLKDLPDYDNETEDYMVGFFRGWLAADCHVGKNSHVSLCLSEEYANWFLKHSARWGYVAQNVRELGSKTNFGTRTRRTFTISIDRTSLTSEDFLIKRKRDKFIPLISKFCIDSVKELEIQEEVFCAEVPDTNTFVLERGLVTGNCAAIAINHPRCFDEIMYLLSCGCGVGFSVERQYVNQLPDLPEELNESETVIKVKDSKIGWSTGYKELISMLYSGNIPKWDLSSIRPAGSRLRTFGGRASGPEPLGALMSFTVRTFRVAVKEGKRKLNSLEVHDICCKIADAIIAGGVRRSATISFSNLTDDRMRRAKNGDWYSTAPYRTLANNSVAYTEKPDLDSFSKEWRNLYISKSGERGIVNKEALRAKAESCGREYKGDYLLNPCFHPDTEVETVNGRMKIKDIVEPTYLYSMDKAGNLCISLATPSWKTKENAETIRIHLNTGRVLTVTPDHKVFKLGPDKGIDKGKNEWVEAKDLKVGDKLNGLYRVRRGARYSGIKLSTDESYRMEHRLVYEGVNEPLLPEFDVHHINGDTYDNSISNLEALHHSTHSTLTRYECENNHMIKGSDGKFIKTTGGMPKIIVPLPDIYKTNTKNQGVKVVNISVGPVTDVYDISVYDSNTLITEGVVAANCGEAILRDSGGLCNLTEVIVRPEDTLETLKEKVRLATILGTLQSTLTNFRYLRKVWKDNAEEERLLGVSLTGIMDHPVMSGRSGWGILGINKSKYNIGDNELEDTLALLKEVAHATNKEWADKLGIQPSKQLTLVKPSGTVSQLVNSSSGIHPRYAEYYVRRVTQDSKDSLTGFLVDQGVPYVVSGDKYIFSFYVAAPANSVTTRDMSAMEQLELWLVYRDHWCDGNPSQTIYYSDNEYFAIAQWVWDHWDSIGGLSFFPRADGESVYENAPYEEITEDQYKQATEGFPSIAWELFVETEDTTTGMQEYACAGGSCDI